MKKRGREININLKINLTNRWLYSLIAIGILAIIGVGVYAYNSGLSPSVMWHSAGERDLSGGVNGNAVFNGPVTANAGINTSNIVLKTKVIEIGDWNMATTVSVDVNHGISDYTKIRIVDVVVRGDSGSGIYYRKLDRSDTGVTPGTIQGWVGHIQPSTITLSRLTGGIFTNSAFDATSYNRGWITVTYEA